MTRIIRVADDTPEREFTIIRNAAVRDERLSWRARGLLVYLVSCPPGWETSIDRLVPLGREGRDAVATALRELESFGYLTRTRLRDPSTGKWRHASVINTLPRRGAADRTP
jgi:hypothetical protein